MAPRLSPARTWISSRTMSLMSRSIAREEGESKHQGEASGVVARIEGGERSIRRRSAWLVSPLRVAARIFGQSSPRELKRAASSPDRRLQVSPDVFAERLERGDVDDREAIGRKLARGNARYRPENAVRVLPDPVGARARTWPPAAIRARRRPAPASADRSARGTIRAREDGRRRDYRRGRPSGNGSRAMSIEQGHGFTGGPFATSLLASRADACTARSYDWQEGARKDGRAAHP